MNAQELIKLYEEGESLASLNRLTHLSTQNIKNILMANNIHIRSRSEQTIFTNKRRKKSVNDFYFTNIENVNQAWLLGFLAADGSISKENNSIKIALSSIDREILEKIKEEVSIENQISDQITNKGFQISEMKWSSSQQKQDLAFYGIVNNKTDKPMYLPNFQNDDLKLAYILGYYDGDGSFTTTDKYCRFRICSHRKEILESFIEYFKVRYKDIRYSLNQDNRGLYELSISTNYAIKILIDMYNLKSIHLSRKYNSFQAFISTNSLE